ncbi:MULTISPECIES: hypothetical protein [unclassified Butyrivibrio]|uniref:hypothetical protein n=1 Tax=unclassified Butyrivibrio TaxID=2639466 RepID=UPI00041AF0ED|nr:MULTISPECIES: hypothetical protein [unclassified Butyrivibrio]MDC7294749.1 hypothetical protein [Butyrivibrio sp. DSM 10294]
MVTTVTLQAPFEYSWWVILLGIVLLAAAGVCFFFFYRMLKAYLPERQKKEVPKIKRLSPQELFALKRKYEGQLQGLLRTYSGNQIEKREAYQDLSMLIREFVRDATGIHVENYTVKEIKSLGIRRLDMLMDEYYVPEFAEEFRAKNKDFITSVNTALGVIRTWS